MAEGQKGIRITLLCWLWLCEHGLCPAQSSGVPEQAASFSLRPTVVSLYAHINRHTWEVYFRFYGYCATSRNSFKMRTICCQVVTSKVLVAGPGNPAVFLGALWRFVCFSPWGGSRWTTARGLVFTFQNAFPVSPLCLWIPAGAPYRWEGLKLWFLPGMYRNDSCSWDVWIWSLHSFQH